MFKEKVVSIEVAAYLVGTGLEAVRQAIRKGKIARYYTFGIGGTPRLLLPLDLVLGYWNPDNSPMDQLQLVVFNEIQKHTIQITNTEYSLEVLWGGVTGGITSIERVPEEDPQ